MEFILNRLFESQIFIVIAVLGLTTAVILDQLQVVAKVQGAAKSKIASGYHNAMKLLVLNRVGAVFYFTSIAIIIETKHGAETVQSVMFYALLLIVLFLTFGLGFYRRKKILTLKLRMSRLTAASMVANFCNLIGLTVPWLLGSYFMEYRLMLANTSFIVNSLYTVINVLYLEKILADAIDESPEDVSVVAGELVIGRLFAAFVCCLGIFLI